MIAIEQLVIHQGAFSLGPLTLEIPDRCYAVVMGPTGCGKTTFAEVLCGLRSSASGRIVIAGEDCTHVDPGARGIGYVPQDGAMFPNSTVAGQLAFGLCLREREVARHLAERLDRHQRQAPTLRRALRLRPRRVARTWIAKRVRAIAGELGIDHLLDRLPQGLSGGERQRVALGRALIIEPRLLVLDEPLAALDDDRRQEMISLLHRLQRRHCLCVIHITHSRFEAEQLADLTIRLDRGQLVGIDGVHL